MCRLLELEGPMGWLTDCFAGLPDPRTGNATRHDLLEMLTIALVGSICGAESCVDFADFARDREALFRDFLKLEKGLPSHDTFSRLFRLLDPAAFAGCFGQFLEGLGEDGRGVLAIDGKTLRRSFDRAASASPLAVVTAFACDARLVLGQVAIPAGGNEITAARALLGLLDLTGMLVTGDAIHCQTATARLVQERGGEWLFALKANRPVMLAEVGECFADPQGAFETHITTDADHGRLETRRHIVCHDVAWLFSDRRYPDEPALPGLATLAMVEATTERDGRTSTGYDAIMSPPPCSVPHASPRPCAPTGASRTPCTGCSTPHLTRTAPATDATMRRKTSPLCESWPSTYCVQLARTFPSAVSASAPDGPMTSHAPSSAKCDSPGHDVKGR